MSFQSVEYILFILITFTLYWTLCKSSKSLQNGLLVAASAVFYGWWDWRFLGLLLFTSLSTYCAGRWMQTDNSAKKKIVFITSIVLNISILFFFKYFNFFIDTLIDACHLIGISTNLHTLQILLPVGISFYTFSALSYLIDIYQGKIEPTKDILAYLAYVMFFPSLLSGPISRAQKQLPQYLLTRSFEYNNIVSACKSILWGGGVMKLCLADRLGIYVDTVYAHIGQHNGTTLFLASILYTIQIYADFAGYSLIAIGSGKLFGIELPTNFVRPYFAKTVTDFWRRWHISLTTWFRDYIYFPLGGNRCSKTRWMINTMIVFVISGLWHGAAYTFLIWGAMHGLCMIVERLVYGNKIKTIEQRSFIVKALQLALTFTIVNFAWIFFRIDNLSDVLLVFQKILTDPGIPFFDSNTLLMGGVAMVIVFIHDLVEEKRWNLHLLNSSSRIVRYLVAAILACYILSYGVLNGGSFIYFQF